MFSIWFSLISTHLHQQTSRNLPEAIKMITTHVKKCLTPSKGLHYKYRITFYFSLFVRVLQIFHCYSSELQQATKILNQHWKPSPFVRLKLSTNCWTIFNLCTKPETYNNSPHCTKHERLPTIDKLYTQIVKVFCLYLRIEPFAVMCWALVIVLAHILKQLTQPDSLASLNSSTGKVLYGRGQLGSMWLKTSRIPTFFDLALLFIYASHHPQVFPKPRVGNSSLFFLANHSFFESVRAVSSFKRANHSFHFFCKECCKQIALIALF